MQNSSPEHRILDDVQRAKLDAMWLVRDVADRFHQVLEAHPPSQELKIAKAKIEEAVLWAVRGIPHNPAEAAQEASNLRSMIMDLYDRIIAAVASVKAGDTTALQAHVAEIDAHLTKIDSSDTDEQTRLSSIEAGLTKIADAVNPVVTPPESGAPAPGSDTTGAVPPADGSGGAPATDPTA